MSTSDRTRRAIRGVESLPDRDQRMLSLGGVVMAPVDDDIRMLGHRDAKLDLEKLSAPRCSREIVNLTSRQRRKDWLSVRRRACVRTSAASQMRGPDDL